ncbi:MAG: two-component system response regulator [Proteobacteria bacterium]|nr:MAG: two-component system response regulator [Pseudomonadota bacterium]
MTNSNKTILVVEDDNDTLMAICTMLESLGFNHSGFTGAKEALKALPNLKIDLALLDIMMPEMNGYELLQEIKKLPNYKELPIIMVTAKDKDSEILEGYQFGADYYITKPFTSKQLEYGIKIFLS